MNCISRTDDKKVFVQRNNRKSRWNLYSQIAIENDKLKCANETYPLIEVCNDYYANKPCTLQDTTEVVNIGIDIYSNE